MKPLHVPTPLAAHRAAGQCHAHVADVLRQPVRRAGLVRTPDRRVAIANLRRRYRPAPRALRWARYATICIGLLLLALAFRQRDPYVTYPDAPAQYALALSLLQAECGGESCTVSLDLITGDPPSPALADAMRQLGVRSAEHNPWVGESWFAPNVWERTALHRNEMPTAEQLRIRRNRERSGYDGPGTSWTSHADGWFTRTPRR